MRLPLSVYCGSVLGNWLVGNIFCVSIGTGRLANAAVLKRFEHIAALGPLQIKARRTKGTPHTYCALFEPGLVNTVMFTVAGPWSYFLKSSLYSND